MKIVFSTRAWVEYLRWQEDDPTMAARINRLIEEALRSPFVGIGKPEPLRGAYSGWWSRRIDDEHRLACRVSGEVYAYWYN